MKYIITIIIVFSIVDCAQAQIFNEWFRQKQTQKKYLIEQIAALQVYTGYVEKGYTIARNGLNTIGSIKKGDLNLHGDYFNSLKSINPSVQNYVKVAEIIRLQLEIVKIHKGADRVIKQARQFNSEELAYMDQVYGNILNSSTSMINDLINITTAGQLDMKDDERLKRINGLYADMQDLHVFSKNFFNEAQVLAVQRQKEQNDVNTSRLLNGIK